MASIVTLPPDGNLESVSRDLNTGVVEYLRSVQAHDGANAFDRVAANLLTDVCTELAREFGREHLLELLDEIEAIAAQSPPRNAS